MLLLRFPIVTSVACMLMLNAMNVWSHAKTDVITVSNGDRITGAMTEMTSGKLSVSTSYAGTISVKWREVSQIDSRYVYEVRLDDGERIYGRFAASDIPEQLAFRSGGKDRQLDIDDVVEVRSIEDNLADKLDLQLSSTINADPRSRQLTLQANGSYDVRGGRTRFFARVNDNKTIDRAMRYAGLRPPCLSLSIVVISPTSSDPRYPIRRRSTAFASTSSTAVESSQPIQGSVMLSP